MRGYLAAISFWYGMGAVRSRRWRYIRHGDGNEELYDHDADPHEWTNLAGDPAQRQVKQELARSLLAERAEPGRARRREPAG